MQQRCPTNSDLKSSFLSGAISNVLSSILTLFGSIICTAFPIQVFHTTVVQPDSKSRIVVTVSSSLDIFQNLLNHVYQDWYPISLDIQMSTYLWKCGACQEIFALPTVGYTMHAGCVF